MKDPEHKSTDLSFVALAEGHALLFQGFPKQALFIQREHLLRFIDDPAAAAVLVIPPFAATALEIYLTAVGVVSAELERDLANSPEFVLRFTLPDKTRIVYFSDPEVTIVPWHLAAQKVATVITPKLVGRITKDGARAVLDTVASIPVAQLPDYPRRFVHDPKAISLWLRTPVTSRQRKPHHEN